ncbi:MAG: cysteine--tRNA ligase [Candidatus Moranbacteria bacterium]|nr:cysteine--tRNA ligase [Candidatus Moranbacteria bacterium]
MLKLYNTLTKKKEIFNPIHPGKAGLYVCGPTVYDHCHLGHARGYTMMDVLRRYLEYSGFEVRHIMNYTDVGHLVADAEIGEDKVEKKAKTEKVDPMEIANRFIQSCQDDFRSLNIKPAHFNPRPTKYIAQIINFVQGLIKKGYAYEVNGSVYFSVEKFPDYGKLSGKKKENLIAGARVEVNPDKKNPLDFALWIKAPKEHILKWESPWGVGYPGWHIECSVMSYDLLGQDTFDIHGGGNENVFPHNENEIAQSEAFLGKPMANFWTLWNMVTVSGEKMGKSLGNFVYIKDALKKYDPMVVRLWILSSHYRSVTNYTEDALQQARVNLQRISDFVSILKTGFGGSTSKSASGLNLASYEKKFEEAMNDDLNTPVALAVLYELITEANKKIQDNKLGADEAKEYLNVWEKMNKVFGFVIKKEKIEIPGDIRKLAEERETARMDKDFQKADNIRKKIEEKGYLIEDVREGYKIKPKS